MALVTLAHGHVPACNGNGEQHHHDPQPRHALQPQQGHRSTADGFEQHGDGHQRRHGKIRRERAPHSTEASARGHVRQPPTDKGQQHQEVGHHLDAGPCINGQRHDPPKSIGWAAAFSVHHEGVHRRRPGATGTCHQGGEQRERPGHQPHTTEDHSRHLSRHRSQMRQDGQGQPWQEGSRLDGIPRPVAAPIEDEVRPEAAESDGQRRDEETGSRLTNHPLEQTWIVLADR